MAKLDDDNQDKGFSIAVLGATGSVGREILSILIERGFPIRKLIALASERSEGKIINYSDDQEIEVISLKDFNFSGIDIVLSSPGSEISKHYSPIAADAGAVVIDNTSYFRMDPLVPLVVPEVNSSDISEYRNKGIIANPNCSTIQMEVPLKPLHDHFNIRRIVVTTFQSTSGAGRDAMDELFEQTKGVYANKNLEEMKKIFSKKIAFNVIPQIDIFMEDGSTKEEWKMVSETKKILGSSIEVHANCARVPTFIGHAEYINIQTEKPIDPESVRLILNEAEGVSVVDHRFQGGYVTPEEAAGEDPVYVSRIRSDQTVENGISFWCVADNLRKGAALNAVQIAEILIRDFLS